jgi:hypothetical protein
VATAETDLAWAAGFIDGEGCVSIVQRWTGACSTKKSYRYYQLNINVPQINKDPLLKLQKMFGGQIQAIKPTGPRRQSFVWTIHAALAGRMLSMLVPYLIVKKNEAELALQYQNDVKPRGQGRLTDWDWAERQAIAEALAEHHKTYIWEDGG